MKVEEYINQPISAITGVRTVEGNKFGIELELEGRNVALQDVATRNWHRHNEPSLRGESIEFATIGGFEFDKATKAVEDLFKKFKEHGAKINDSVRTSTHVHLNFSDKSVKQVVNFFSLFTLLEEVLQYYSGADRKGIHWCLATREAEGIIGVLASGIGRGDLSRFAGDRYKYGACNLSSLFKFGTIEVRTMRGAVSAEQVIAWLDILNDMYNYACNVMVSPAKLVTDLSELGAEGLMKTIFSGKNYKEVMSTFPVIRTLHNSLMEGARLIQIFAYEFDEAFRAKVELPKPPKAPKGLKELPYLIPAGFPNAGKSYCIYKPNGERWYCRNNRFDEVGVWQHGERLADDPRIFWSAVHQRFVVIINGDIVPCRWRIHHEIPDEGMPGPRDRRPMPPEEREEDVGFDDEEDREGDDW